MSRHKTSYRGATGIDEIRHCYIYKLTDKSNGKIYIGVTSRDFRKRMNAYRHKSKQTETDIAALRPIDKAIAGKDFDNDFIKEVIEEGDFTIAQLSERERYWITYYDSEDPDIGYNRQCGGIGLQDSTLWYAHTGSRSVRNSNTNMCVVVDVKFGIHGLYLSYGSLDRELGFSRDRALAASNYCYRINKRYFVFHANYVHSLERVRKAISIIDTKLSQSSKDAVKTYEHAIRLLENYRIAAHYMIRVGMTGTSEKVTDADVERDVNDLLQIVQTHTVPEKSKSHDITKLVTVPLYTYNVKDGTVKLYTSAKELERDICVNASHAYNSARERRRIMKTYYVYYTDADKQNDCLTSNLKSAQPISPEYMCGLGCIRLLQNTI